MSLIQGLSNIGSEAMRAFVATHEPMVRALARRYLRNASDADDAVQEVFVELWRCAHRYDAAVGSEAAFVSTVARRRLIDRRRAARRRSEHETFVEMPENDGVLTRDTKRSELHAEAAGAMRCVEANLRPEQQDVLVAVCEGLSHEEIAERTGMPLGTVKAHARRGLGRLRRELVTQPGDSPMASRSHDTRETRETP